MLSVFAIFGAAYSNCTETPKDITFSITEDKIQPHKWNFYSTHHNLNTDHITIKVYTAADDLVLYAGEGIRCPDLDSITKNPITDAVLTFEAAVDSELGIYNFGIYNSGNQEATYIVSARGDNPNNFDSQSHTVLIGIFLALCILLLILFFVHSILARDKVYYKVDVQE